MAQPLNKLKFIKSYSDMILEQELDADGMPLPPEPEEKLFTYLFIKKDESGKKKYPDGSSSTIFDTYEITDTDLKTWLEQNVTNINGSDLSEPEADIKRKTLYDYFSGKKNNVSSKDQPYIKRFKTATETELIAKEVSGTEVYFSKKENDPSTEVVDATFITIENK